jgi:hypothetical protein
MDAIAGELDKILIQNENVCLDAMECSSTSHLHSTLLAERGVGFRPLCDIIYLAHAVARCVTIGPYP